MNHKEVMTLLGVGALIDARLSASTDEDKVGKAIMWAEALDNDMPVEWARKAIASHYADSGHTVMPADLNRLWRVERKKVKEAEHAANLSRQLEAQRTEAVPMPEHVREQLEALKKKWSMPEMEATT